MPALLSATCIRDRMSSDKTDVKYDKVALYTAFKAETVRGSWSVIEMQDLVVWSGLERSVLIELELDMLREIDWRVNDIQETIQE